jgi:hypothetical protein
MTPIVAISNENDNLQLEWEKHVFIHIELDKSSKITNLFIRHPFQRRGFPMTMKYINQHLFYTSIIQKFMCDMELEN